MINSADIRIESDLKFVAANYAYFEIPFWHQLSTTVLYFKLYMNLPWYCCCCCIAAVAVLFKVWRYCELFSALLLLLNTLRGLKKKFKFWFKFVVASRKIRLQKLDNTETNHPRNAFNGWLRHPLLKIMKKSISSTFLKMVGIFNFYKLPFDIDFIVLCRLTKTCSLSKAPTRIFPHKLVMYTWQ